MGHWVPACQFPVRKAYDPNRGQAQISSKTSPGTLRPTFGPPTLFNDASVLYWRFLRELIRRGPPLPTSRPHTENRPLDLSQSSAPTVYLPEQGLSLTAPAGMLLPVSSTGDLWSEPMHFSAMSDNQIIDAVNRAGSAFGTSVPDVPVDDMLS